MATVSWLSLSLHALQTPSLRAAPADTPSPLPVSVEIACDRTNLYQHQTCTLTLSVRATNVVLAKDVVVQSLPDPARLVLAPFEELPLERSGPAGQVSEIRRYRSRGIAGMPGSVVLAPLVRARVISRETGQPGRPLVETPRDFQPPALTLTVLPLPDAGRPVPFAGAVGAFAFDASVSPRECEVGQAVVVRMAVSGTGHLPDMPAPPFPPAPQVRVEAPRLLPPASPRETIVEQLVIPQSVTVTSLPALTFSFFDPTLGRYQTVTDGPFPLSVHPARSAARVIKGGRLMLDRARQARFAPSRAALVSFELPAGATVKVLERREGWSRIEYKRNRAWLQEP